MKELQPGQEVLAPTNMGSGLRYYKGIIIGPINDDHYPVKFSKQLPSGKDFYDVISHKQVYLITTQNQ